MAESADRTSRRAVATAYGDPTDVVEIVTAEIPPPGSGQVLVCVAAAGVNPIDVKTVQGAMSADESKLPLALGFESAGTVVEIGPDVTDVAVGDEVIVYRAVGGYTDLLVADVDAVHPRPAELDVEHAAGLLLVGVTAADTVATTAIGDGDVVVIHGGSGAVGTIAIQLARAAGATVITTARGIHHDFLRSLGATPVEFGDGLLDRIRDLGIGPITAAIDTVGTDEAIDTSLALVPNPGRIASIAAFGRAADGIVLLNGSTPQSTANRRAAIPSLIADAASGALVTEVAKTFPLAQAGPALTELSASHPRGKFVLIP